MGEELKSRGEKEALKDLGTCVRVRTTADGYELI